MSITLPLIPSYGEWHSACRTCAESLTCLVPPGQANVNRHPNIRTRPTPSHSQFASRITYAHPRSGSDVRYASHAHLYHRILYHHQSHPYSMHPLPLPGHHPLASLVLSFLYLAFESSHGVSTHAVVVLLLWIIMLYHLPIVKHRATLRIFTLNSQDSILAFPRSTQQRVAHIRMAEPFRNLTNV